MWNAQRATRNVIGLSLIVFCSAVVSKLSLDASQSPAATPSQVDFFESKVRPLLVESCFDCHTDDEKGGLRLDSREAILKGGDSGPASRHPSAQATVA